MNQVLGKLLSLDKDHSKPVAHSWHEIKSIGQAFVNPLSNLELEHLLSQLVRSNKILKIGLDDNYQKCLFIRIDLDSMKANNNNRVKEFTTKLSEAVKNTAKSSLNFKKSKQ